MEKELISVIVPVYNVEKYLDKCIESIVNQTYKNLEIILIDDGSPDNCHQMCDEWANKDRRIKIIHKENGGLSDARNTGINVASGKYISFIDSDDYIENNYIEVLYNSIITNNSDMAIGAHKVIYENGKTLEKATGEVSVLKPEKVLERILYDDGIDLSAWAKLYKKEDFKSIQFPKGRLFEDAATTYKLIDKCDRISIESKPIYNYIMREQSITNIGFNRKKMDLIISTEEMCNYIKKKYPELELACDRRLLYAYLSTLTQLAMSKEKFSEEQKILMKYIRKNGNKILKDKRAPIRDKVGIIATKFGFNLYKIFWNIYRYYTGRNNRRSIDT